MQTSLIGPPRIDPVVGRAKLIATGELELTAYHEAGHAVMAYLWGGDVRTVEIDARAFCSYRIQNLPWEREAKEAEISLAGKMAEQIFCGEGYDADIDEDYIEVLFMLMDAHEEDWPNEPDDDTQVCRTIKKSMLGSTEYECLDRYHMHARNSYAKLKLQRNWVDVERIAKRLIESGDLQTEDEVLEVYCMA